MIFEYSDTILVTGPELLLERIPSDIRQGIASKLLNISIEVYESGCMRLMFKDIHVLREVLAEV
jgi:hypothetical protein